MGRQYARGERAWGICGRSGRKMLLRDMIFDGRFPNMRVDPDWYEARHPLETLPMVDDPVALYRPSPEVIDAPSAPVVTLVLISPTQVNVTWTPAETDITEIASYIISRSVNGGAYVQIATCVLQRDFLGGITGITNATMPIYPERPGDPWATVPPDQPMTYVDNAVTLGSEYCYQVQAVPMGNNQSVAQGPPVTSAPVCVQVAIPAPTLTAQYDYVNNAVDLSWSMPTPAWASAVIDYQLYRSVNGGAYVLLATQTGTSYTDGGASYTNSYSYYVVAQLSIGNSPNSNTGVAPFIQTITYTVNGVWQKPSGAQLVRARAVGGGAGGGGAMINIGSGKPGYGGAYGDGFFAPSALPSSVDVTVGAAGTASAGGVSTFGSAGGDTSFGSFVIAHGGVHYNAGGATAVVTGALSSTTELGGTEGTAPQDAPNTTHAGASGAWQGNLGGAQPAVPGGTCTNGPGGSGGSTPAQTSGPVDGGPGSNHGGGGAGGGYFSNPGPWGSGGVGAPGVCIVDTYT